MANTTELTCPLSMRRNGFHLLSSVGVTIRWFGIKDTVVIKEGDLIMDDGNGAAQLGTDGGLTDLTFFGVAVAGAGAAAANANDNTLAAVFMVGPSDIMWAKKSAGTLVTTSVGEIFDLESEVGIDQSDTTFGTRAWGFHALAVDTSNQYALGRWINTAT